MKKSGKGVNRRQFLKFAGAAGIGSIVGRKLLADSTSQKRLEKANSPQDEPNDSNDSEQPQQPIELPKRKLGKTGVEISCLALGVAFNAMDNQLILRKSIDWGVSCWDTSNFYENGNSELGIGKFLEKNPDVRNNLFLITKASNARSVEEVEKRLQTSLSRMKTDHIDMFCGIHGLSNPTQLNDDMKRWAEKAKERKVIRFFGFSTHSNMPNCLMAASKLDWIDTVMTSYNFRLMQDQKLLDAVQACHDEGIGIIAMKTQGKELAPNEADKKLTEHFIQQDFSPGQAKIKLVLENKHITAACVGRESIAHLRQNIAAALDKTELTRVDKDVLKNYAMETCTGYCAGCANICDAALPELSCVSDVMRYLMYYNSLNDRQTARELFAQIPYQIRNRMLTADYTVAERNCPQRLPIGRLMTKAISTLA